MKYLKFTSYAYLAFAVFFVYDGITKWETGPWMSFGIAAMGVFMFFFRSRYAKKFEDKNPNNNQQ